jgi:hypothetical protein
MPGGEVKIIVCGGCTQRIGKDEFETKICVDAGSAIECDRGASPFTVFEAGARVEYASAVADKPPAIVLCPEPAAIEFEGNEVRGQFAFLPAGVKAKFSRECYVIYLTHA